MLKLQTQQQVEVERLKRSLCQVMTEKATQFSPLLTRQFFEELTPIRVLPVYTIPTNSSLIATLQRT
jgi:hypothetical protein